MKSPFKDRDVEIMVSMGKTINMGNYESARVDVSLKTTCVPESADKMYINVRGWVDLKLTEEIEKLSEEMNINRKGR